MENPSHISRRVVLVIAGLLVLTSGTLVGLNAWNSQRRFKLPSILKDPYIEGYQAARTKYASMCPGAMNLESFTLSGVIVSVGSNSIVIDQDSLDTNLRVDGISDRRTVEFTSATKILSMKSKSASEISAELSKQPKGNSQIDIQPFTQTILSATDLKAGMRISVTSDQNVRYLESIPAVSILVPQS